MARKQETPASTAEAKDSASPTELNTAHAENGSVTPSPEAPVSSGLGEGGTSSAEPGATGSAGQDQTVGQAGSTLATDVTATDQSANANAEAAGASAPDDSDQAGSVAAETGYDFNQPGSGEEPAANPNPAVVQIYPMRSYMDEGELRRRGGPAYTVPRRHAEELVQKNLASFDPLKE
ncbi:hypothetical protein [Pseudomonas vranovensis]|uniref:hypothetical protein n=1 Tax=Pseudomonas vranovensis TaxID=321661 RepID=UPI0012EBDBC8|nr:hypothetical protein [Pseudomonas vranovensis]